MDVVHSLTLPIHTLHSQVQVSIPHRDNEPPDPGGSPLPSGGGDRQTTPGQPGPMPETERPRVPAPNTVPNDPHPYPERGPCKKEGSTWSKLAPPTRAATE
ncbi:hypothetical protein CHARACLAT_027400 [Characodon lateralis]|uniref:Uncharacterized protein n=1 Tax=Characodon lateralis TaxID=208331 RepID=A0ABU7DAH3_9TELE|nr:hypothetical protein [Characodon lateralis]